MISTSKIIRANVWKFYAYWFCHSLIFAYVIERLFALERGLSIQQMVFIEIIYAVVVMTLEVPTGAIADRWSRSKMMVISAFFIFFEFFVLIFAYDFWLFALSALSAAIGGALASGTSNALLYDSLKMTREESRFEKELARIGAFEAAAGLIAALAGGWIAVQFNLITTYVLSLIGVTAAFLIALTFRDPPVHTTTGEIEFSQHIKQAFSFIWSRKKILFVIIYGTVMGAAWIYVDEFWQIYAQETGFPVLLFGLFSGVLFFPETFGGFLAPLLNKYLKERSIYLLLLAISLMSMLSMSLIHTPFGLIFLFAAILSYYVTKPLVTGFLHHQTESKHRATVESFYALMFRLGGIIIGLPFGYISTEYSIFAGFAFLGGVLLLYGCIFLFSSREMI